MSRSYHRVYPAIWDEPWDDDTRYLALYLLTCEHRRTEGLFRLRWPYVLADIGWTEQRLTGAWQKLTAHGFIEYDQAAGVVWIVKAVERQPPDNKNHAISVVRALADLPATPLIGRFVKAAEMASEGFRNALRDTHPDGFPVSDVDSPPLPPPVPQARYAEEEEDANDPIVEPVTNPALPAVLDVLQSIPRIVVEPLSIEHVLAAHAWADEAAAVAAAHDVGAWMTSSDPPRSKDAGTLLRSQLRKAAGERRGSQVGAIKKHTQRRLSAQEQDQAARMERMAAAMPTTMNGDRG